MSPSRRAVISRPSKNSNDDFGVMVLRATFAPRDTMHVSWLRSRYARTALAVALTGAAPVAAPVAAQTQQASITGQITAENGQRVSDARIFLLGTTIATAANQDGRYTLRNVPAGTAQVRVLRVGYREEKKTVVVTAGSAVTLDFVLVPAVVQLQEIVTTATGEQRKVELGHTVATLGDVGKIVENSSVTNMSDLLVGKTAGVNILPQNMTGTAGQIHIRGVNSLSLNNNPIWVVDGVRFNASPINIGVGGTQTSFLNGLNPEEIEDIEIVKGPSAATLYGTDAANGVIVVTTKKGKAGSTRWTWFAEGGSVQDKNKYPTAYAEWGHSSTGAITRCLNNTINNGCTFDSLTSLNVLATPGLTPLSNGHRDQYGLQVNGGSEIVRFFASGELENELGPIKMPGHDVATFQKANIPVRDEWLYPEAMQRQSIRGNMNMSLSPTFDLAFNAGFIKTNQRLPQVDNNFFSIYYQSMMSPGFRGPGLGVSGVGTRNEDLNGNNGYTYGDIFQTYTEEDVQRTTGSINASWRPFNWMQNEGTVGMDLAARQDPFVCRFNECPDQGTLRQGSVGDQTSNYRNFSAKATSSGSWQARNWLNLKTTVGGDYTNIESDFTGASGTNLPPGAQVVGSAATRLGTNQLATATKTLGVYAQEQFAVHDRLFITAAVRSDQNSAFGTNFQRVLYPKLSASWILSDESFFPHVGWLNQFRLRSAYGASGVQPGATSSLQTFATTTVNVANLDRPGLRANALGNPDLKPETSAEIETGFDTRLLNNRVSVEFTYYRKKTTDALIQQPLAPSSAASGANNTVTSVLRNLGSVQNDGVELTLNTTLVDRRNFGWDLTVSAGHNNNKVLSLGVDAQGKPNPTIGTGGVRDSIGLPVNAYFYRPYTFNDANGDGYISASEITISNDVIYRGYSIPRDLVSFQNGFDLFKRKLRINTLIDYKGGSNVFNSTLQFQCQQSPNPCYDISNPSASVARQARAVAENQGVVINGTKVTTTGGFLENSQFWRLREVSGTLTLPSQVSSRIHARDASLTFAARNLHVWTGYTGADPESNFAVGDTQTDFATTSPPRYFIVRMNLHY
jgi:TonB-linked SusC/RagA family outer membrane protein